MQNILSRVKIFSFVVLFLCIGVANASNRLYFETLSGKMTLSRTFVTSIAQDSTGFMWFGTAQGLYRYDGHEAKQYTSNSEKSAPISHNMINALLFTTDNSLWVATNSGLNVYNSERDSFSIFNSPNYPNLKSLQILVLFEDSRGAIWVGTTRGMFCIDKNRKDVKYISLDKYITSVYETEIRSVTEDSENNIWIGTSNGLFRYVVGDNDLVKYDLRTYYDGDPHNNLILSLMKDPWEDHTIWVGSETGLHKYKYKNHHELKTFRRELTPEMFNNRIRSISYLTDSSIIFGTDLGLYTVDRKTEKITCYRHSIIDSKSISGDVVRSIFRGKSGIIWFGSASGLSYVNTETNEFHATQIVQGSDNVVNRPIINYLTSDPSGDIWIATYDGVIKLSEHSSLILNPKKYISGLTHSIVRVVHVDKFGTLWAGTDNGLHYFDKSKEAFVKISLHSHPLATRFSPSIVEDSKGNIWVPALEYGMCAIYPKRDQSADVTGYDYKVYNLTHQYYNRLSMTWILTIDKNDNIWAITYKGEIFKYDASSDQLIGWGKGGINGMSGHKDIVQCFRLASNNTILVGTNNGLYKYDSDMDSIIKVDLGIYRNNSILSIQEDLHNSLWLATGDGMVRYDIINSSVDFYSTNASSESRPLVIRSNYRDNRGVIYFGGVGEFISFNPSLIKYKSKQNTPVVITEFLVDDVELTPEAGGLKNKNRLETSITKAQNVTLRYDDNSIKIHFSLLNYSNSQGNNYKYILEGFDKEWSVITNGENVASYSNLSPGEYRFKIKGSYDAQIWDDTTRELVITITAPWWRSWWAYTIIGLVIMVAIYSFYRLSVAKIKLHNEVKYQKIEREKSEELNQHKLRFFTNISHEFRTPLTLIIDPIDQILSETEDPRQKEVLTVMRANGQRLLRLTNQIMDFRKVDYKMMKLELSYSDAVPFVVNIFKFFVEHAEQKKIKYSLNCKSSHVYMMFDGDKLEKTIYNLISNAFKFTPESGEIQVSIEEVKHIGKPYFVVSVKDNGVGIDPLEQPYVFDRFYQCNYGRTNAVDGTGIGLTLCKEFVELHQGEIQLRSEIDRGSEFKIFIPVIERIDNEVDSDLVDYDKDQSPMQTVIRNANQKEYTVLVVEDSEEMNNYIALNLEGEYNVMVAKDGQQGWEMAVKYNPDLILSDVMMPKMDGKELCKKIKAEFDNNMPFVLLTAVTDDESIFEGFKYGADDYIVKPFTTRLLKLRIAKLLESKKLLQEHYKRIALLSPRQIIIESEDDKLIADLVGIIEENIDNSELKIDLICSQMNISHHQLYRRIKSLTGQTVNDFVRSIRIKRAAQLFETSDMNISEVMYSCGFTGQSYFSKCFQQQYQMKPSEYAAKFRNIQKIDKQ